MDLLPASMASTAATAWWLGCDSSPAAVREACTHGAHTAPTAGLADGHVQANLAIVPAEAAAHFREFCRLNPRSCPLLEELPPGERHTRVLADGADLATCLPRYRVWRDGVLAEVACDVRHVWRDDLCAYLLGCSFSFEAALQAAGIRMRHVDERKNVPMYRTNRPCEPGAACLAAPAPGLSPRACTSRPHDLIAPFDAQRGRSPATWSCPCGRCCLATCRAPLRSHAAFQRCAARPCHPLRCHRRRHSSKQHRRHRPVPH